MTAENVDQKDGWGGALQAEVKRSCQKPLQAKQRPEEVVENEAGEVGRRLRGGSSELLEDLNKSRCHLSSIYPASH